MAADSVRMDAFSRAIRASVRPGDVVLDLGAGTGIMSLLAVRAGAARVHAVDPNPAIWLVPEIAKENGVEEGRIVVHQASSLEMAVPEAIDVVVSDMRGASPLLEQNLAALRDIKARWVKPGAVIMPTRDVLRVALVEADGADARLSQATTSFERRGFHASAAVRSIRNQVYSDWAAPIQASDVLSTVATWAELDYHALDVRPIEGTVALTATRSGLARGLTAFFETELVPGIGYTTAPGHGVVYNRLFLPLREPVAIEPGDEIALTMRADPEGERYAWDTRFTRAGRDLTSFRQSTFLGQPISMAALLRTSDNSTPSLSAKGELLSRMLACMDGITSLRAIASKLATARPGESAEEILAMLRNLSGRYGA